VTLTFDLLTPKLTVSCRCLDDHLCQFALKSVHSFTKYFVVVLKFGNAQTKEVRDRRMNGQVENIMPPAIGDWRRHYYDKYYKYVRIYSAYMGAAILLNPRSQKRGLYAMAMSFCLFVRLSVRLSVTREICKVIRYAAAPGDERRRFVSTSINLFTGVGAGTPPAAGRLIRLHPGVNKFVALVVTLWTCYGSL